jgi:simple sugar transport system ATP-binding protein
VVLITHKLREALANADEVTVLRRGVTVLQAPAVDISEPALLEAMLGSAPSGAERAMSAGEVSVVRSAAVAPADHAPVVSARSILVRDHRGVAAIRDASFELHAGSIVGVAAVEGSGHRELLRALAGRVAPAAGTLRLPITIGCIPEDRHREALVGELTLTENIALRGAGARRGWMRWRSIAAETEEILATYAVVAPGPTVTASTLSGGNQQRLVLGRELHPAPALIVAENPTRGLDVRASVFVFERLREARDRGAAVVVHASDIDEVLVVADRVLVVHAGIVREAPLDREAIGRLMLGAA